MGQDSVAHDMANTVLAVRHGQRQDSVDPDWEETADRVHDPPLTELGRWAAWRVGRRFAESPHDIDRVVASPFLRTVETATEICREIDAECVLEAGLGEHRNPEWFDADPETLPHDHLAARFDRVRIDRDPHVVPEFPEAHDDAMARVGDATRHLVAETEGTLLLVGHGLTMGGVVDELCGTAEAVEAPLCGVTRIERDGDHWHLACTGETTHLDV